MSKKYLIIFFVYFFCSHGKEVWENEVLYACDFTALQAHNHSLELCMEIWTELDLLGAIRTSTEDLMYFADKMIDKLLTLEVLLAAVKRCHVSEPYFYEDVENLSNLVHHIDERFYDIFSSINCKEVSCCLVLIERFLDSLEKISFSHTVTNSMLHQALDTHP